MLKLFTAWYLFCFTLMIAMMVGWTMNLINLVNMVGQDIGSEFILRLAGVPVVPLGSILGWFL